MVQAEMGRFALRLPAVVTSLLLLCNSIISCGAFTTSPRPITSTAAAGNSWHRSQLLYADNSNHVDAEYRSLETECVATLRSCSSMPQIYLALEESVVSRVNVNDRADPLLNSGPKKGVMIQSASPNVAAAALRRMTQLDSSKRQEHDNKSETAMWALADHLLESLNRPDQELSLTRYALLDVLSSLAFLERKRNINQLQKGVKIRQLSNMIVQRIHKNRELVLETSSAKLVDTLYAFHVLSFGLSSNTDDGEESSSQQPQRDNFNGCSTAGSIQIEICQKLVQGHYLGKMSPGDMSIVLTTLATIRIQPLKPAESTLAIGLMRRFRKQAVRQSATTRQLLRALHSVAGIGVQAKEMIETEGNSKLHKEAQLMVYTVFKELLQRLSSQGDNTPVALHHISSIVSSVSSLNVLKGDGDASLQALWKSFLERQSNENINSATVEQISRFLRTVESSQSADIALPPQIMQRIGEHFLEEITRLVKQSSSDQSNDSRENVGIDPKSANTILRCATLKWGHNTTVMKPFQNCAHLLFTNDDFLARSQAPYLTNYMSFLEKERYSVRELGLLPSQKDDPLLAIGARILKHDVSDAVTPAQASRILSSFTSVSLTRAHHRGVDEFSRSIHKENSILFDLFHNLGGHLLTSSSEDLSPRDISSALCAYAKASYVQDMGIFDHLAESLAARVQECSVRQATQSLWACGRMAAWEQQQEVQQEEDGTLNNNRQSQAPPYLPSAEEFAAFLLQRQHEMTSKDVVQTIWALGRLESVQNPRDCGTRVTVGAFLPRATKLAPQLTSPEIANILWGMSQTGWRDCGSSVESFTERLLDLHHSTSEHISPQEAASVMLALGRMQVVNEEVFEVLSNDILDQLDTASAQAIANALWAYRALHISPPPKLLDRWAFERLGLNPARSHEQGLDHTAIASGQDQ